MRALRIFLLFLLAVTIGAVVSAQTNPVSIGVTVSCSSITVTITSTYARAVKAQVYAGTGELGSWDLVDDIGDYTRANPNSSTTRTYGFSSQRANTLIFYSVRVYDDETSRELAAREGSLDCDGTVSPTATPRPNTTATATPRPSGTQSSTINCENIPANARSVHIVQADENLFRIGLRYGVHYTSLAQYNGIADPARIFVGQCIAIPPAQ